MGFLKFIGGAGTLKDIMIILFLPCNEMYETKIMQNSVTVS